MRDLCAEALKVEQFVCGILEKHFKVDFSEVRHVSLSNPSASYDIFINGLRFDVKHATPTFHNKNRKTKDWSFDIRNKQNYCDYLVLVGLEHNTYKKVYLIDKNEMPTRWIRISIHGFSKWNQAIIWQANK